VRQEQRQQPGLIAVLLAKASLQLGRSDEQLIAARCLGTNLGIVRLLGASALGSRAMAHLEDLRRVRDASFSLRNSVYVHMGEQLALICSGGLGAPARF
jgi:hypothetical protein